MDTIRLKLIDKAKALLKRCNAREPDFDNMDNGDLIAFIRSLSYYVAS